MVALTGCALPTTAASASRAVPAGTPTSVAGPTEAVTLLAGLSIAVEDTGAHYDRDNWPHWTTTDGCDVRARVLQRDGENVVVDDDCRVVAGVWASAYDGLPVTDPARIEVDHIVPLKEATRSGPVVDGRRQRPGDWPREQRRAYANDPAGLLAVSESSNATKSDGDPARWMPAHDQCGYVRRWIEIKTRWQLSVDQAEHDAIASVLSRCGI